MNRRKQNTMNRLTRMFLVPALLSAATLSLPGLADATTFSTWHDSPLNISNAKPFATLNIPQSGSYVIFAKLDLVNDSPKQHTVDCKLNAAQDSDEAVIRLGTNAFGAPGGHLNGEMVFTVVHTFTGTNNIANLSCGIDEAAAPIRARFIKITAIRVDFLINTGF